jgi:hypothetical protein
MKPQYNIGSEIQNDEKHPSVAERTTDKLHHVNEQLEKNLSRLLTIETVLMGSYEQISEVEIDMDGSKPVRSPSGYFETYNNIIESINQLNNTVESVLCRLQEKL